MRATVDLNEEIIRLARFKAVESKTNLAGVIETALKEYLPSSLEVKFTGNSDKMELEFVSSEEPASGVSTNMTAGVKNL